MGQESCKLDRFQSACELHVCVANVRGLVGDAVKGASPSGKWIVALKNGTTYDDQKIERCFLKFWSNQGTRLPVDGLKYELLVNVDVIRVLVDQRVCPNFSRYLGHGEQCNMEDLHHIATTGKFPGDSWEIINQVRDLDPDSGDTGSDFSILVTEFHDGLRVEEYFQRNRDDAEIWEILLQLAIACYALFLSKTAHNDLHHGNVMLVENDSIITYKVEQQAYTIKPKYMAKVFDFDHAYSLRHGNNDMLIDAQCNTDGGCNEIVQGRDVTRIFWYFYTKYRSEHIFKAIFKTEKPQPKFQQLMPNDTFDAAWYATNIFDLPTIISNVAKHIKFQDGLHGTVYDCSASRFDHNGALNSEKIKDECKELKDDIDRILNEHKIMESVVGKDDQLLGAEGMKLEQELGEQDRKLEACRKSGLAMDQTIQMQTKLNIDAFQDISRFRRANKQLKLILAGSAAISAAISATTAGLTVRQRRAKKSKKEKIKIERGNKSFSH